MDNGVKVEVGNTIVARTTLFTSTPDIPSSIGMGGGDEDPLTEVGPTKTRTQQWSIVLYKCVGV
jgi:hypothetical protein